MDVELRDVTAADLGAFFEHQRDPEATSMAAFTARDREAFEAHWARILDDPAVTKQTIVVDGAVAGNVVSFDHDGMREIGYWIGREHWGRGIATTALEAFLRLETRRPLGAGVATHNRGSIRVLEKCGFAVAGTEADGDVEMVRMRLD